MEKSRISTGVWLFLAALVFGFCLVVASIIQVSPQYLFVMKTVTSSSRSPATERAYLPAVSDGLIAYYPFNGNANDESGHGHHGVARGVALAVDRFGKQNSAYRFDGTDDYIEVPDDDELDLTLNLTIAAWILQKNIGSGGYRIVDKETAGTGDGYHLDTFGLETPHRLRTCTGARCVSANTDYALNEWHHVVLVVSGTTATFYLDGRQDGGGDIGGPAQMNTLSLFIGRAHLSRDGLGGNREFFDGIIDDVRLYNRALTEAEVQRLYKVSKAGY